MSGKRPHFLMRHHIFITDESNTLTPKRNSLTISAKFTTSLYSPMSFFHVGVELLHSVDKEGSRELIRIVLRQDGVTPTLRAREGLVVTSSLSERLDAFLTVVVKA